MSREPEDERSAAVLESRREVEDRMAELRTAIRRETGMRPKARYTLLALAAGAVGMALAARRRKKKRAR